LSKTAAGPAAEWLAVGYVRRPHGVHGEVAVEIVTDFPERMVPGLEVRLGPASPEHVYTVTTVRSHKGAWLLSFEGVGSRDAVEGWRTWWVFLPAQDRESLPRNYFYEHELAGLRCVTVGGTALGEATELSDAGGGPLLLVRASSGEVMVPFRSPIVVRVDLHDGTIVLDPPHGLFDDDAL
jgi:16S rRNA processing protein RimM